MSLRPVFAIITLFASLTFACSSSEENSDAGVTTHPDAAADASVQEDATTNADAAVEADATVEEDAGSDCVEGTEVVHFTTSDGVELEGDLYTTGALERPLVVLVHMIPPANTRRTYPAAFIDEFLPGIAGAASAANVLNIDRRGAGGSGGVASDAYMGEGGALDVEAAVRFFMSHTCGDSDLTLGLVGASNGTTSVLDYAILAADSVDLPQPTAISFLSPGVYTENQTVIADRHSILDDIEISFIYPPAERAWSQQFFPEGLAHGWDTIEWPNGDHGTRMFTAEPDSIHATAAALLEKLNR